MKDADKLVTEYVEKKEKNLLTARPFHCGTQFLDWEARNCNRCNKGEPEDIYKFPDKCDIYAKLVTAAILDGDVEESIAKRMGCKEGEFHYTWDCPERELRENAIR